MDPFPAAGALPLGPPPPRAPSPLTHHDLAGVPVLEVLQHHGLHVLLQLVLLQFGHHGGIDRVPLRGRTGGSGGAPAVGGRGVGAGPDRAVPAPLRRSWGRGRRAPGSRTPRRGLPTRLYPPRRLQRAQEGLSRGARRAPGGGCGAAPRSPFLGSPRPFPPRDLRSCALPLGLPGSAPGSSAGGSRAESRDEVRRSRRLALARSRASCSSFSGAAQGRAPPPPSSPSSSPPSSSCCCCCCSALGPCVHGRSVTARPAGTPRPPPTHRPRRGTPRHCAGAPLPILAAANGARGAAPGSAVLAADIPAAPGPGAEGGEGERCSAGPRPAARRK